MAKPKSQSQSQAARIEHALTLEILRGHWPPGSTLPPVRALAGRFDVTPPTVQRVIDRLESQGLVTARRGSGVRVNDVQQAFDLSLLPLWFEAVSDDPVRAGKLLGDFLELRRVVAVHLVRTALPRLIEAAPELARRAHDLHDATETPARMEADLAFTRAVVSACDQLAVGAVFSIAERLVREVPDVAAALYEDEDAHHETVTRVVAALGSADANKAAQGMDDALADWDRRAVTHLVERLRERNASVTQA